jgi:hypothetical protein
MNATRLSPQPTVHPTAELTDSRLGTWTEVGRRSVLIESSLDDYSYVMDDCHLMYTRVGKFASIANQVRLNPSNHPTWRPSQHHFTYRSAWYGLGPEDEELFAWRRSSPVELGHDVWVGHGAVVMPGVRIGTGAVIGARAVVTKDVPDYGVAVGVPAKVIRLRFSQTEIQGLRHLAWWDWSHELLAQALPDFRALSIQAFLAKYL